MAGLVSGKASDRQMSDKKANGGHTCLWLRGYGNTGNKKGEDISSRFDYDGSGLALGMERDISDAVLIRF
jgi:hypothetical protein